MAKNARELVPAMTRHAIERALDMGVTAEEIRTCLLHPEDIYDSQKYPDTVNYRAGRIVLAIRDSVVVTVGWSSPELWCQDMALGEYGGRTYPHTRSK